MLPQRDLPAVIVCAARDPVVARDALDDQQSPVGQHEPLEAGPRLAGVRERLATDDLPECADRIACDVLWRLAHGAVRPRAVRLVPHDAAADGLNELALPREPVIGAPFELNRQPGGKLRLVPPRELAGAGPPRPQLRHDRVGPGHARAASRHAPIEQRVLGVEVAEPSELARFECGSQSPADARGHNTHMFSACEAKALRGPTVSAPGLP